MADDSAPINRLPFELLSYIFILSALPGWPSWTNVFKLQRVCAYWRSVAIQTPELWNLRDLPMLGRNRQLDEALTARCLERSAALPLKVVMRELHPLVIPPALLAAWHRWQSLHLVLVQHAGSSQLVDPDIITLLSQIPSRGFKNLRDVELEFFMESTAFHDPRLQWTGEELRWNFEDAPHLKTFKLRLPRDAQLVPPTAPWSQLQEVSLQVSLVQWCFNAVAACTNAPKISISTGSWPEGATVDTNTPVPLPNLEIFNLTLQVWGQGEHFNPFLRRLRTPRLYDLTLGVENKYTDTTWVPQSVLPNLERFLRDAPNLRNLDLQRVVTTDQLLLVLRHTPNLVTLAFSESGPDWHLDHNAFYELASLTAQGVVPKLENVHFEDLGERFGIEAFEEFVRSRFWSGTETRNVARLQTVSLNFSYAEFDMDWMRDVLDTFRSEGLNLYCFVENESL
uniref:F-box domain-containing protein n=1 Tax=Mycena chlorophos TaxID=658473 RepID=A0ABQ0M907_MYCCL|nr:predicted protein [Mycena chlorophos]